MSMITATTWVPRGVAAPFPTKYVFDEEEYARIAKLAKLQLDDAQEELDDARSSRKAGAKAGAGPSTTEEDKEDIDDDLKEYDMEHYDDDNGQDEDGEGDTMGMFGNVRSLAYHQSNAEDPYITLEDNEEDEDERDELQILATDNLVLAARIEDEVAHLEVYVYEDEADNLYVHHDIMLPAIPLAVEWLDLPVGKDAASKGGKGNFVAVGTMEPDIEIWDLDTVDCMYPNAVLGQAVDEKLAPAGSKAKKKKKKKKAAKANDAHHVDAVLALAANRHHRNLLASASADKTVKLWDLHTATCAKSYGHHTDKVCALAWHPTEPAVLLSGSYDRTVVAADVRAPAAQAPRWGVESDVEAVRWDPHAPHGFFVATEAGAVHAHDARLAPPEPARSRPAWTLQAHDAAVSALDVNAVVPGFLATGSPDRSVKLWSVGAAGPALVVARDLGVGKVFGAAFAPDAPVAFRLAVAGSRGAVQVWDTSTNAAVRAAFATRVAPVQGELRERLVGVADDEEESDDEEEEEKAEGEGPAEDGPDGWESMEE